MGTAFNNRFAGTAGHILLIQALYGRHRQAAALYAMPARPHCMLFNRLTVLKSV